MADELEQMDGEELDPKALKKAEKERKKEERALKRAEKKKKNKKDKNAELETDDEEEGLGSKILVFFVTLIIIVLWLGIIGLLIKWDVGGFGSTVLAPVLKDVPYVNKILPETEQKNDYYGYESLEEAVARIKELEKEIEVYKENTGDSEGVIDDLQKEVERLKVFEEEQKTFEENKTKFYEEVVFGDKAPDINEYKTYYELIDPTNAEALYKQVLQDEKEDKELEEYVKTYSTMTAASAAKIMEGMTDDLKLVAKILQNMTAEQRGKILAAMNADTAASLTKLMEP